MLRQSAKHKRNDQIGSVATQQHGFTIIEVLIVLAIVGLIMVVVFLAVPALQRSGRNNALNSSARNILSAASTYPTDNGGSMPSAVALSDNTVTVGDTGTNQETANVDSSLLAVSLNGTPIKATGAGASAIGTAQIITGTAAVCNDTASGISGTGSSRSVVVLYVAEGGSTNLLKCIGS